MDGHAASRCRSLFRGAERPSVAYTSRVDATYELFDHTADMGIRVRAATLPELLRPAGEALYAVIGEWVPRKGGITITFDLTGGDVADLLRDYLGELLILFERDRQMATSVDATVFEDNRLRAAIVASPVDEERSLYHREVKAITYHELAVRPVADGLEATLIVDI